MNKKDLYKIDKDISIARTLDSSFYIDKNLFNTLVTDIFHQHGSMDYISIKLEIKIYIPLIFYLRHFQNRLLLLER